MYVDFALLCLFRQLHGNQKEKKAKILPSENFKLSWERRSLRLPPEAGCRSQASPPEGQNPIS